MSGYFLANFGEKVAKYDKKLVKFDLAHQASSKFLA